MKKFLKYFAAGCMVFSMTSCLDVEPQSEITDASYWKEEGQFSSANTGLQSMFRDRNFTFYLWGEMRSNLYGGSPFSGEASAGYEVLWDNLLSQASPGISNYGGCYMLINQLNLMIAKSENTDIIKEVVRKNYLGSAYGMRAFMYFQLLRTYGDVIVLTDYTKGSDISIGNMAKAASPAAEVMAQIKKDIEASEKAYGDNYKFANGRNYWSLAATKMLKGEVYLWSGKQMGGGTADYQTAKAAYEDVKKADVALLNDFTQVFAFGNKKNKEIIYAVYNGKDESKMWGDSFRMTLVMGSQFFKNHFEANGNPLAQSAMKDMAGVMRVSLNKNMWKELYRDGDTRKAGSLKDIYIKNEDGSLKYVGNIQYKFQGTTPQGYNERQWFDDYPIYRYADCLLGLAEAKALLNENPAAEINEVRKRAYGEEYFNAHQAEVAYPNDTDASFYANNSFVGSDANVIEAVLKERCREFLFEGKRWHDLRLMGAEYVTKYSSAQASKLLWPIDENTLGVNNQLHQTPGYEQ